ncbi:MAG TPA: hypothetical protein VLX28_06145 [Thermoanaerobaculia bacterium]|nr:hypothetical protein [Thermoanaerobaculia bacterium]
MQEPHADPLAPPSGDVIVYPRKRVPWGWYHGAVYFGMGGLLFLVGGMPANPATKPFGVLMELASVGFIIKIIQRRKWNATGRMVKPPEPYADLQASMASLHEAENRGHDR